MAMRTRYRTKKSKAINPFCALVSFFACGPAYSGGGLGEASRSYEGLRDEPVFFT